MSRLSWDPIGGRFYETGTKYGVLYPQVSGEYPKGVAWDGLTGVTQSPSGAEATAIWADDLKYLNLRSAEEFGGTITAYQSPEEFDPCDGSATVADGVSIGQQTRQAFGLCYRTVIGNDTDGVDHGYKLHLIYNATVTPSERAYATQNDSPEAVELSWTFDTVPLNVTGYKPTALIEIDSTKVDADKLATLEDILYGTDGTDPRLPLPDEVIAIMTGTVAPKLTSLAIGSLELTPAFSDSVTEYAAATTNSSDSITAAGPTGATIVIKNGNTTVTNGGNATWSTGSNTVTVKVSNTDGETTYTVTVTKE